MIKIAIIDDQEIMTKGLKMILEEEDNFEIVATGENGYDAVQIAKKYYPDVVLMDIKMPEMDGVEATRQIMKKYEKIKIIILTTFKDEEYISKALKYGAMGYLLKESAPEKIVQAINTVNKGGALIQPEIAVKVIEQFKKINSINSSDQKLSMFTTREKQIIFYISKGLNNSEIAEKLFIAEGTVKNNITKILKKSKLRDRTQVAIFGLENNIQDCIKK